MAPKLTGNKVLLIFVILSFAVNIALVGYIFLNNSSIQLRIPGGNSQIIGKWEKVLLDEDRQYEAEATPIKFGLLPPAGSPTSTPTIITVIPTTCRSNYPKSIEFFNDGTYTADLNSLLRGGDYQLTSDGRLKTKYLDDSLVTIDLLFQNDQMILEIENCKIVYQRVQ